MNKLLRPSLPAKRLGGTLARFAGLNLLRKFFSSLQGKLAVRERALLTVLPSTLARLPVRAPSLFTTIADLATLFHK